MKPLEATTSEELIEAVLQSTTSIDWVDRRLLIQTIGIEDAQRFLPALPDSVAVNMEELALVLKANHNEALVSALARVDAIAEQEDPVPYNPKG